MRYVKNVVLFIYLIVIFISLWVNIIIINSQKTINLDTINMLNGIYFDPNMMKDNTKQKIDEIINSNKSVIFSKMIDSKDALIQFYGLCGLLKSDQKIAIKHLDKLIMSSKVVTIFINGEKKETMLGVAVLMLLDKFPPHLTNKPREDFFVLSAPVIDRAKNSNLVQSNSDYSAELESLIQNRYTNVTVAVTDTTNTTVETTSTTIKEIPLDGNKIDTMTNDEKKSLSLELANSQIIIPSDKRDEILMKLLNESDKSIVKNIISILKDSDSLTLAELLFNNLKKSYDSELIVLYIEKYCLIKKSSSIENLETYMKTKDNDEKILTSSLNQISKYGSKNDYDFLKYYLETKFSSDLNILALRTIIQTTYKSDPANVLSTLNYVIKFMEKPAPAAFVIDFYTKNSISSNSKAVIARVEKKENNDIIKAGIDFIVKFKIESSYSFIKDLTGNSNTEIKQKALDAINALSIQ